MAAFPPEDESGEEQADRRLLHAPHRGGCLDDVVLL
jgi:hypothetical protein